MVASRSVMAGAGYILALNGHLGWQRTGLLIRLWILNKVILNNQETPVLPRHCRETQESQGQRQS